MSKFSQTPARTSVPSGSTRGKPAAAVSKSRADSSNRQNKELQMNRLTVQTLAQMLADQQAATTVQFQTLGGIVADLALTVRSLVPAAAAQPVQAAAPVAAPIIEGAFETASRDVVVVKESKPRQARQTAAQKQAAAETKRLEALARGRATALANRKARQAAAQPVQPAAPAAPVQAPVEPAKVRVQTRVSQPTTNAQKSAAYLAWQAQYGHMVKLQKIERKTGVAFVGKISGNGYVVAWNRTARAWDWNLQIGKRSMTGRAADRAAAFAGINHMARVAKVSEVRV